MSWLASLALWLLHSLFFCVTALSSWRRWFDRTPLPLTASRKQLPSHLALLLTLDDRNANSQEAIEECFIESLQRAVSWARTVGITRLTVYERQGLLRHYSESIRSRLSDSQKTFLDDSTDSELEYPLTPPLSDDSDSRPISPSSEDFDEGVGVLTMQFPGQQNRRRQSFTGVVRRRQSRPKVSKIGEKKPLILHVVSRDSSKPAIASVARHFARASATTKVSDVQSHCSLKISVHELNSILEGNLGLPSPDLMIVHRISGTLQNRTALELEGFPPWQIRLTEIYHETYSKPRWTWFNRFSRPLIPLDEIDFRNALDEYSRAEMRLGK